MPKSLFSMRNHLNTLASIVLRLILKFILSEVKLITVSVAFKLWNPLKFVVEDIISNLCLYMRNKEWHSVVAREQKQLQAAVVPSGCILRRSHLQAVRKEISGTRRTEPPVRRLPIRHGVRSLAERERGISSALQYFKSGTQYFLQTPAHAEVWRGIPSTNPHAFRFDSLVRGGRLDCSGRSGITESQNTAAENYIYMLYICSLGTVPLHGYTVTHVRWEKNYC